MDIDLETAARTLVVVAMAQGTRNRVTPGLIVAVLAPKFCQLPQKEISALVAAIIVDECGIPDPTGLASASLGIRSGTGTIPSHSPAKFDQADKFQSQMI